MFKKCSVGHSLCNFVESLLQKFENHNSLIPMVNRTELSLNMTITLRLSFSGLLKGEKLILTQGNT